MPYDTKYALIDISTFTEKAAMVEGIYQYIIQSAWNVTSLTASNFLGVGMTGIPPTDYNNSQFIYTAWINGSTYIENFCLLNDNVSISKTLEVTGDLLVSGNTTISNLLLENTSGINPPPSIVKIPVIKPVFFCTLCTGYMPMLVYGGLISARDLSIEIGI